jgi:DNA-binding response OmpR family regulator
MLTPPPLQAKDETDFYCQSCGSKLKLKLTITPWIDTIPPKPAKPEPVASKKVLVAVEGEVTYEMISEILSEAGYEVITASDGQQALDLIKQIRPRVSIVDVGLPNVFESLIAENMKQQDKFQGLRIILVSSIHDRTKYKREPESLYGADDYIERHHIQDKLLNKVDKLMELQRPVQAPQPAAPKVQSAGPDLGRVSPKSAVMEGDLSAHDAAKRLARIIISDIALYSQKKIEEGLKNDTLREVLKDEIEEGLRLYQSRTPREVSTTTRYYEEALMDFIQKQKTKFRV